MSTETQTRAALARRAVATHHWRWMSGMTAVDGAGHRSLVVETAAKAASRLDGHCRGWYHTADPVHRDLAPDLSDPATLGCLTALVREAWGDPCLTARYDAETRRWYAVAFVGTAEAEALVMALEAAP